MQIIKIKKIKIRSKNINTFLKHNIENTLYAVQQVIYVRKVRKTRAV